MATRPTPYSIALSALIALHCQSESPLYESVPHEEKEEQIRSVDAFLQTCLMRQHSVSCSGLLRSPLFQRHSELSTAFCGWLEAAASSIDALTDLMISIQTALEIKTVDPSSWIGIFLRQVSLGWDSLAFEETIQLWNAFQCDVEFCISNMDNSLDQERQRKDHIHHLLAMWPLSTEQRADAWNQACWDQSFQLPLELSSLYPTTESHGNMDNVGSMESRDTSEHIGETEAPSRYFYQLWKCLQTGERVGAVQALHQYLDSSSQSHAVSAVLQAACQQLQGFPANAWEAVRVAQQSQDPASVALALGWLALLDNHSSSSATSRRLEDASKQQQWMKTCAQRAAEVDDLQPLAAGANLWLALHETSPDPHVAWQHWRDALAETPSDASNIWERATHLNRASQDLRNRHALVGAALWDDMGQIDLARLLLETVSVSEDSKHSQPHADAEEAVAVENKARSFLYGSTALLPAKHLHDFMNPPKEGSFSRNNQSAEHADCVYGLALNELSSSRNHFATGLIAVEWAIRRGDLSQAQALLQSLQGKLHPRIPNYHQIVFDLKCQEALLLSQRGESVKAKSVLRKVLSAVENDPKKAARILIELVVVHLETDSQFSCCLEPLEECCRLAKLHTMDGLHASALSLLAQIYFRMGQPAGGLAVLKDAVPNLLQQGHVWLQGQAYLTSAQCRLQVNDNVAAKSDLLESARLFWTCQDRMKLIDVYYLLAQTAHSVLDTELREKAAKCVIDLQLLKEAETPVEELFHAIEYETAQVVARKLLPVA